MAQVNRHLRCLFIIFNIFFVVVGGLTIIISLALLSPSLDGLYGGADSEVQTTSHIVLCIFGSLTLLLGVLGAYGAQKENLVALTVYLVCMVTGSLLMLRAGVPAAAVRPQLETVMEERWRSLLPLDQASDNIKTQAEALQTSLHCCGLFGYKDWGGDIPRSCLCNQREEKCQTADYSNFVMNLFWQKKSVFIQPCFPLIVDSVTTRANITVTVDFTLLALALLGLVQSSLVVYQMFDTSNGPDALPSVPVTFGDRPPAYSQLFNLPE